ncbi:MAG: hypothetical protein DRH24_19240 [Deltaproteobacteria bacterium]|nr:MAG: hypothetical protein DRH24_19240 [Deltaproteobacteria bacterium]
MNIANGTKNTLKNDRQLFKGIIKRLKIYTKKGSKTKVCGRRRILDIARHLYKIEPSACVNIETTPANKIAEADKLLLLGTPWDNNTIWDLLEQRGETNRAVRADRPGELHFELSQTFGVNPNLNLAFESVYHNFYHRTWYAYPLIVAVSQAQRMGIKELTVIEFGVWQGDGLLNLASLCEMLTSCTSINFRVVGFDTGAGLPNVTDYRDHPELWYTGELKMPNIDKLRRSLPDNCELIIGDIANTLSPFVENLIAEAPIGFVALDVDTYSSSVAALNLFEIPADFLLPVVPIYVDDSYVNISQSNFTGEALAINEFNKDHELRKIDHKIIVRPDRELLPWQVGSMYFAHIFDHPVRAGEGNCTFIGIDVHKL